MIKESSSYLPFPLTVLYVEDDPEARELTRFFLGEYFERTFAVEDAETALEIFLREEIDLVLADLSLPGFDGFEMLRRMRSRKEDLSIVIFSAFAETHQLLEAIDFSVDGYLLKPFEASSFDRVIVRAGQRLLKRREECRQRDEMQARIRKLEAQCHTLQHALDQCRKEED